MVEKRTCDYSGVDIEPGTGIMYVKTDGTVLHFADSKCEKNYLMGREPRDLEWIQDEHEARTETPEEPEEEEAESDDEEEADADEEEAGADEDDEADADGEGEDE